MKLFFLTTVAINERDNTQYEEISSQHQVFFFLLFFQLVTNNLSYQNKLNFMAVNGHRSIAKSTLESEELKNLAGDWDGWRGFVPPEE